jgi:hypothetical protein
MKGFEGLLILERFILKLIVISDPYKSEGIVQLKIEKLSQFAQSELNSLRQSDAVYVRGFQWKIMAKNMEKHCDNQVELQQKVLGYYIECSEEPSSKLTFHTYILYKNTVNSQFLFDILFLQNIHHSGVFIPQ